MTLRDRISVKKVPYKVAKAYQEMYHEYMDSRHNSSVRHGIFLDGHGMVGCVEYAYLMCRWDMFGYESDSYMEIARVCFNTSVPNAASCGLMMSVRKFKNEYARSEGIKLLVTYVRDDYRGTLFEACGFEYKGKRDGQSINDYDLDHVTKSAGRGSFKEIYNADKKVYIFRL